jgi:hypothetical protein
LIKYRIERKTFKRIKNAASVLHTNSYKVTFDKASASISVDGSSGSNEIKPIIKIGKNIPLSEPTTGYMRLPLSPHDSFDYDGDIGWKLFREGERFLSKHYGWVGEVTASTYTRGELKSGEWEPAPQPEEIPEGEGTSEPES